MRLWITALLFLASPLHALNEGLQCVPYARAVSGIQIRGDAHTWWDQADGRYDRGTKPKVGAVLSFKAIGTMPLGHVAAVSKIIDRRTILVRHSNWSTINGNKGHIENDVRVMDVSDDNDWSAVRVWYAPIGDLGTTHYPVNGFIYPGHVQGEREIRAAVSSLLGGVSYPKTPLSLIGTKPVFKTVAKVAPEKTPGKNAAVKKPEPSAFMLSGDLLKEIGKQAKKERK